MPLQWSNHQALRTALQRRLLGCRTYPTTAKAPAESHRQHSTGSRSFHEKSLLFRFSAGLAELWRRLPSFGIRRRSSLPPILHKVALR